MSSALATPLIARHAEPVLVLAYRPSKYQPIASAAMNKSVVAHHASTHTNAPTPRAGMAKSPMYEATRTLLYAAGALTKPVCFVPHTWQRVRLPAEPWRTAAAGGDA